MEMKWVKSRKEITQERLQEAYASGAAKVTIRKGKSKHAKAQKMAKQKIEE